MTLRLARVFAVLTGSLIAASFGLTPSVAKDLPDWKPRNICANDSARGQCLLFEERAQNDITASWAILPESVQNSCLTRFVPPLEPSWRILGDCIEIEGRRAQQLRITKLAQREDDALKQLASTRTAAVQARADAERAEAARRRLAAEKAAEEKRVAAEDAARRKAEQEAAERAAAAKAAAEAKSLEAAARTAATASAADAEDRRVAAEEASFMALLAEQRRADAEAEQRADAARKLTAAQAADAERKRVADEEASFMARLAEQRKADAEAERLKAEAKKAEAAEAERRRVAAEEASFMARLAEQRKADAEAERLKAEAKKAKAAEADRRRVAAEEASFMARLAEQRKADAEAEERAKEAKKLAAAKARETAAQTCQAQLAKVKSSSSTIQFAYNSAELSSRAGTATLDKLAEALANCEEQLTVLVEGHTDSRGTQRGNLVLSNARAEAVADYLRGKGIAKDRISSRGFAATKPIASNRTSAGRARNRRIEFTVK